MVDGPPTTDNRRCGAASHSVLASPFIRWAATGKIAGDRRKARICVSRRAALNGLASVQGVADRKLLYLWMLRPTGSGPARACAGTGFDITILPPEPPFSRSARVWKSHPRPPAVKPSTGTRFTHDGCDSSPRLTPRWSWRASVRRGRIFSFRSTDKLEQGRMQFGPQIPERNARHLVPVPQTATRKPLENRGNLLACSRDTPRLLCEKSFKRLTKNTG